MLFFLKFSYKELISETLSRSTIHRDRIRLVFTRRFTVRRLNNKMRNIWMLTRAMRSRHRDQTYNKFDMLRN